MKKRIILLSLVMLTFFTACKDEKSVDNLEVVTPQETAANTLKVTLNAVVKVDDAFQLFYKSKDGNFDEKKSLWFEFKGSDQPQDIVFNIPEDELPTFLRLDFGVKKDQKEIKINSFKIEYMGKTFEAKGKEFYDYFYSNELVANDKENAIATPITKDGNYDPVFCSAEGLEHQIELLIK